MKNQETLYVKGRKERKKQAIKTQLGTTPEKSQHVMYCEKFLETLRTKYRNDLAFMGYMLICDYMNLNNGNAPFIPLTDLMQIDLIGGNDFTVEEDMLWYTCEAHSVLQKKAFIPVDLSELYGIHYQILLISLLLLTDKACKSLED